MSRGRNPVDGYARSVSTAPNPYGFPPTTRLRPGPAAIDDDAVRWFPHPPGSGDRVVLLLHGLGSNEDDLYGLAPQLPRKYVYVSLRGSFASGAGYAWLAPPPVDPSAPDLIDESSAALERWITEHADGQVVGAIGFSQGAMLALHLLRRDHMAPAWVVALSGAPFPAPLPADDTLAARCDDGQGVPALWGHGGMDPLFDADTEDAVRAWMREHTDLVEARSPQLGHGVDERVLAAVIDFVASRSAAL